MNTTSILIKTEANTKKQAQEMASEFGLSLSGLINVVLKQAIRSKKIELSLREVPSPYFVKTIKQSEENYKKGKVSPSFQNVKDAIGWLEDPNAKYQNGDKV